MQEVTSFISPHLAYDDQTLRYKIKVESKRMNHSQCQHMRGPLSYIGGKTRLAKQIVAMLPAHTTYVEVFSGGAQVLFRKEPSAVEILNDLDGGL
jgi:hypothetical protein